MGEERIAQRIEIKEGIDWHTLDLEPIEAFVLSRIERGMTLDDLIYISGLSKNETCQVVQSLVNKNILFIEGFIPQRDELEIDRSEREKIDRFYNELDKMNYYQILNVPFNAPLQVIKQQFYSLSKEFHPDRYYKKNIGEYKKKIEEIYKKIREAYEVLSDKVSKEIYSESASAGIVEKIEQKTEVSIEKAEEKREKEVEGVKEVHKSTVLDAIAERIKKARFLFEEGMKFYTEGNFNSALNNFKLSVAYDPFNKKYKEMLSKADEQTKKMKLKTLIEHAEIKDSRGEIDEAISLLEEAIQSGCTDAVAYHNLAKLYLKKKNNLQLAKNYCLKAMELKPKQVDFHVTLGQIYKEAGLIRNARREFELALSLQPDNQKIKLYLDDLKRIEYGEK